jgi:hypothetical protein
MKKLFTLFLGAGLFAAASAQTSGVAVANPSNASVAPVEVLALKEAGYDFGKIPQNRPVTHVFEFVNKGKEPLKLENVQASCGCTTPEWNNDPVAPGATATIKVGYNAAAEGPFSKPVSIFYNGNQLKTITISGTVYKAPATSAPANASISLLKTTNQ